MPKVKKADNKKILEAFYNEYYRSPRKDEFNAIGGNLYDVCCTYGSYKKFLQKLGYPQVSKSETHEVVYADTRKPKVIFTGVPTDIAEELGVHVSTIRYAYKNKVLIHGKYSIRLKKFKKENLV